MNDEHDDNDPPGTDDGENGAAANDPTAGRRGLDPLAAARAARGKPPEDPLLDPSKLDLPTALRAAGKERGLTPPKPVVDTKHYQRRIAYIGFAILATVSLILFITRGVNTPGVAVGSRLHNFVAPLSDSGVTLPANADPKCNPAKPNPQGLNVCGRTPIVLDFFVTGDGDCVQSVNALNRIAPRFPGIQFAAVAVQGNVKDTKRLVREHHWKIPIGVDSDGRVGAVYGVEICPMIEMARSGGIVTQRLIGSAYNNAARLTSEVRSHLP